MTPTYRKSYEVSSSWDAPSQTSSPHLNHQSFSMNSPSSTSHRNSNETSLEETAQKVSDLFSSTVQSLSADVRALNHLTTWKDILHQDEDEKKDDRERGSIGGERREDFLESLCDLDDAVTEVEKKVSILRQIVADEQQALENMNMLQKDFREQNENLKFLVERCSQMKVAPTTNGKNNQRNSNNNIQSRVAAHDIPSVSPKQYNYPNALQKKECPPRHSNGSHEHHAHLAQGLSCHFDPVTREELEAVPRTTRGRLQAAFINEAITEIEKCFHKKAVKERRQQQLLEESRQVALANTGRAPPAEEYPDDEELLMNLVITEQELRKGCSFFAQGEGTARTVLAVLKELKRIKQVPAKKKGLFTYKLCLD